MKHFLGNKKLTRDANQNRKENAKLDTLIKDISIKEKKIIYWILFIDGNLPLVFSYDNS